MAELEIRNLHVTAGEREILKGLDLTVQSGQMHALMGPNGSGKSTLANAIMGHPNLEVTEGEVFFDGEDITEADPDERARKGLFMAFQYPVAVPGVSVTKYLRTVMNALREEAGEDPVSLKEFRGRGVVDAPLASVLSVFNDIDKGTEWMDSCNGSRTVDDVSDREKVVYNRTHAPWPVSDRDAVVQIDRIVAVGDRW